MSQRELLAQAIHDAFRSDVEYESEPCPDDYETADKLIEKGVRVLDHDTLLAALHEPYRDLKEFDVDPEHGTNGRCRACGEDGTWSEWIKVTEILDAIDGVIHGD